jgi:hypothetical protein
MAEVSGTEWELPVVLAGMYALRMGEILGMRWRNVDLENITFSVVEQMPFRLPVETKTVSEMAPTKSNDRALPITEVTLRGILLPSGNINKDKINLVSGAMVQPFAEIVWVMTDDDMDTINRLTDMLVSMNTPVDRAKLLRIIQMLYGLLGLRFSDEAVLIATHSAALEYFIFLFIIDFCEIIKTYVVEDKMSVTA